MSEELSPQWLSAIAKRREKIPEQFAAEQSLRLIHREAPPLRIDKLGPVAVLGWWSNTQPSQVEQQNLKSFMKFLEIDQWYLQWRPNKSVGQPQIILQSTKEVPETWEFFEKDLKFKGQKATGDNVGLFLDQRDNRQKVKVISQAKRVLNLYSFTCGFSVAAAVGGAAEVVSVDLSKKYLEWGKENFQLNGIDPESFRFQKMDSQEYLNFALKKGLQFDVIICDPPTFSRNGKKVFKVEKELPQLTSQCLEVLADEGCLLLATNCEKLTKKQVRQALEEGGASDPKWLESAIDFDLGASEPILKSYLVNKS